MSSFSATYYDRAQLKQYPAAVSLEPACLRIQLETEAGPKTLEWEQREIQSVQTQPNGGLILQNGKLFLDVPDPDFQAAFDQKFPGHKFYKQSFFDKIGAMGCLLAIVLVVLPAIAAYIWLLPALADRAARQISPETERQMGDAMYKALSVGYTVDSSKTRLVQQFYNELGYGGAYDMRITVVQEPVVNAFAVPGGQIVVYDSILRIMDRPEQLAALLAHEASHIQLRHSTRTIFRQLSNSLIFSILLGDFGTISAIVSQQGAQLAGLSYSRALEIEADDHGLELMEAAQIPLNGMPDLFEKMESAVSKESRVEAPDFLSTHPALSERIARCKARIAQKKHPSSAIQPGWMQIWEQILRAG
jgi:predicted Zn-dependent protease